ncbi:hypothetical protein [Flavobacterium sp.]|uniref:hypothetical protein n=1 Tax=Flavobacterium sp. TaxID=239 RepID=UPI00374D43B9
MAIQTLNTIKQWFRTGLKPTQAQFWDTWDSFRHKSEKVPVKDIEGINEWLTEAIPEIPNISGNPNRLTKIKQDSKGKSNLAESNITDTGDKININSITEIDSQINGESGLKFTQLKNESKTISEIVFTQDVIPTAGIDGTAYFPYGNTVKKVNLDKTIIDYYSFPEGYLIRGKIIASPNNGDLFLILFDGISSYSLIKFNETGILSVLRSSILSYYFLDIDKNDNIYIQEIGSQKIFRVNTITLNNSEYYTGNLTLGTLGFDLESNGYFFDYDNRNLIYKIDAEGRVSNFATLNFEIGTGCTKPDGSLYVTSNNDDDKNIYSVNSTQNNVFASLTYRSFELHVAENGFLYVHNNDYDNGLVYKISPRGAVRLFGSAGNSPRYMAVTKSGIVYISNSASYNLIKIANHDAENLLTLDENGNVILSDKEFTAKSDFKTINGESIVGAGDIVIDSQDITLQNLIETDSNVAEKKNENGDIVGNVVLLQGSGLFLQTYFTVETGSGDYKTVSDLSLTGGALKMGVYTGVNGENYGNITVGGGGILFQAKIGANQTQLTFETPMYNDGATILIPSLPTTRTYKLSVAEVFDSNITTRLNKDALNSLYTQARKGDKIHCLDIEEGGRIYEKTSTGWVEYVINVLP